MSLSHRSEDRGVAIPDSIPNDLITEIFLRLPAKSVARFRCVSKQWRSISHLPYFTELFLTRSRSRPRLLFCLRRGFPYEWSFFSSPQLQNPYDCKVSVGFHMKLSRDMFTSGFCGPISGLFYISMTEISQKRDAHGLHVFFNPLTRQYASFPQLNTDRKSTFFLGFDPIDKQFKVLSMSHPYCEDMNNPRILTLETRTLRWRKIHCPLNHRPLSEVVCINGVMYYSAQVFKTSYENSDETKRSYVIVCFDVRSEKYKFIDAKRYYDNLISYKGKLGRIKWRYVKDGNTLELRVKVLEDVEKQKWSTNVYTLPKNAPIDRNNIYIAGVTATGEIVLSEEYTSSERFYIFFFNPGTNTFQRVEIQGFGEYYHQDPRHRVFAFVDLVEDLHVTDAKYLKSGQRLNIIRERPTLRKPQKICNSGPSSKDKYELVEDLE
ncbi:unnamed protein product [Microthlaspi erraticum]|uniref:F-box domain-containing protein n=1 Tax=Microthlaspi erraticum TaxID=1685480 RepID=A0A6D2LIY9_9BRAS|nr:unnamed protein product [Microthlaspi erraticum]